MAGIEAVSVALDIPPELPVSQWEVAADMDKALAVGIEVRKMALLFTEAEALLLADDDAAMAVPPPAYNALSEHDDCPALDAEVWDSFCADSEAPDMAVEVMSALIVDGGVEKCAPK